MNGERLFQELRTASFRKEEFQYVHTGIIDESGDTWTTTSLDEVNLFQVYNQYRAKYGIPFPDEIAALRQHYGLSAAKMSLILGFGANQYRLYEEGEVPSISNARAIMAAREKAVFQSFVEASKSEMAEHEYTRIKKRVDEAAGDYFGSGQSTVFTGYRSLSCPKICGIIKKVNQAMGSTFVTKMNKILFYIDFLNYKRHGYGVTGLLYRALQFGPVPNHWARVYSSLADVDMEEYIYPGGQSGIKLKTKAKDVENLFNNNELATIDVVCNRLKDMNAGQISEMSHREEGWKVNHATGGRISYQHAFALNFD